jgi:predicted Zn-dependent protease
MKRVLGAAAALSLVATTAAYAPALAQLRAISQGERAQGAQVHPQLLQQFGGAYGGRQDAYVASVGKRIAVQSGLSNSERE